MRSLKPVVHPLVYEINTRPWLRELSANTAAPITLGEVPDREFERWHALGFTHIWLMGVWQVGPLVRAHAMEQWRSCWRDHAPGNQLQERDVAGSAYAIAGYEPEESVGGRPGLEAFREKLHQHGLKLLLDFIPNHTGLDHPWVTRRPELFVHSHPFFGGAFRRATERGTICFAHGKDPYFPSWSDTVQLDYRKPEAHQAAAEALQGIASLCDGVRCDMAMLVLNEVFERNWKHLPVECERPQAEFWTTAINAVRDVYPDFLFLAEAYWGLEPRLQQLGFDYVYNKTLYDRLVERNAPAVRDQLAAHRLEFLSRAAHFLENHDERRAAAVFPFEEHRAATMLVLSTPGLRLLHHGQLTGAACHVKVHYSISPAEQPNPEVERMYLGILGALKNTGVGRGLPILLDPLPAWEGNASHERISAVVWMSESRHFELVLVNLSGSPAQCVLPLPHHILAQPRFTGRDLLSTKRFAHTSSEFQSGIRLDLAAWEVQLVRFDPAK